MLHQDHLARGWSSAALRRRLRARVGPAEPYSRKDLSMHTFKSLASVALLLGMLAASVTDAQQPNPYGAPIGVDAARKVASAALAEAKKNGLTVAAAVVDAGGA